MKNCPSGDESPAAHRQKGGEHVNLATSLSCWQPNLQSICTHALREAR